MSYLLNHILDSRTLISRLQICFRILDLNILKAKTGFCYKFAVLSKIQTVFCVQLNDYPFKIMWDPVYNNVVAQILDRAKMEVVRFVGVVSHDV